ncbi:DUF4124 domain-containing protein [Sediminicurvatus halobius]|uniref:DUF4124 domain-containing protein n=1 Tax=Sediminicurvatus halobius TaxID=2182432 RepID=A0A2U2N2B3_9GAMM|nr:DUF4124 domain-containing protein [Spiribacter halobius]PWG63114.1 DUF4124 domain-containing protein [Spiribacter halobius]UEX77563.1 DUF4124 domain-containing protein [Spiribacter halobius]
MARSLRQPVAGALLVLLLWSTAVPAPTYKWVDDEGNVHYSDTLPPEEAQRRREREVKSDTGITVERIEPPPTLEQMEALARQREAEAARDREAAAQAERDRNLLLTFQSVAEMEEARDERLQAIDGQIALTRSRIDTLETRLERRREEVIRLERSGGSDPTPLYEEIGQLEARIAENRAFVERQRAEQARIRAQFARDMARFRELTRTSD